MFRFTQVNTARITGYEWVLERRTTGPVPTWVQEARGAIEKDEDVVTIEGYTGPLSNGTDYRIGVRSVASTRGGFNFNNIKDTLGSKSVYTYSSTFRASIGPAAAPAPTPLDATPGVSGITVRYRTPNVNGFASMEIYASNTNNVDTAIFLFGPLSPGKNVVISQTEGGLTDGRTRYYWARSRDNRGFLSPFSTVISATYTEA